MPQLASVMIRVFPSLEHSTDCVCGLSDTLRECPNVAKTRNGMPATAWKKYVNFASKNLPPSVYSGTFLFSDISVILLINPKYDMLRAPIPLPAVVLLHHLFVRHQLPLVICDAKFLKRLYDMPAVRSERQIQIAAHRRFLTVHGFSFQLL